MGSYRQKRCPAIPGIPSAPIGKDYMDDADREFESRKKRLAYKLPIMTGAEVVDKNDAYHVNLLHSMLVAGYYKVVKEINSIGRSEEHDRKILKIAKYMNPLPLVEHKPKLRYILEVLRLCQDCLKEHGGGDVHRVVLLRKECGEHLMREKDIWLAKYMFESSLKFAEEMSGDGKAKRRIKAEVHCLITFIIREIEENAEQALEAALEHLSISRTLSKDQPWLLKSKLLTIRLKKPITLLGLREDYEDIDGGSMTVWNIATLLEHEMLLAVANHILHHKNVTADTVQSADVFVNASLQLAYLVRQPVALISSLMRFGTVLRHSGEYDAAIQYFHLLVRQAEHFSDPESIAVGYNELGHCYVEKLELATGLEYFIQEKEVGDIYHIPDIQADALQQIGHTLLQEGHLWEAEECYYVAYQTFHKLQKKQKYDAARLSRASETAAEGGGDEEEEDKEVDNYDSEKEADERRRKSLRYHQKAKHAPLAHFCDRDFIFTAIGAGEKLWSQMSGLMLQDNSMNLMEDLIEWKNYRKELPLVPRPNYDMDIIAQIYVDPNEDLYEEKEDEERYFGGVEIRNIYSKRRSTIFGRKQSAAVRANSVVGRRSTISRKLIQNGQKSALGLRTLKDSNAVVNSKVQIQDDGASTTSERSPRDRKSAWENVKPKKSVVIREDSNQIQNIKTRVSDSRTKSVKHHRGISVHTLLDHDHELFQKSGTVASVEEKVDEWNQLGEEEGKGDEDERLDDEVIIPIPTETTEEKAELQKIQHTAAVPKISVRLSRAVVVNEVVAEDVPVPKTNEAEPVEDVPKTNVAEPVEDLPKTNEAEPAEDVPKTDESGPSEETKTK